MICKEDNYVSIIINICMENKRPSDLACLATLIATELTKNKSTKEICELKILLSQITATISTIYSLKTCK